MPGDTLASNPVTEVTADRKSLSFALYYQGLGLDSATHTLAQTAQYRLTVTDIPFPLAEACYGVDKEQFGFALNVRDLEHQVSRELYRDTAIPSSRICPMAYDIGDIFALRMDGGAERYVALLGVYMLGFEGLDRRLIAVPFTLP